MWGFFWYKILVDTDYVEMYKLRIILLVMNDY